MLDCHGLASFQAVFFLLCQNCTQCELLYSIFSTFFSPISRINSNCKRLKVNNCKMNKYHLVSASHAEWHCTFDNHLRDLETDTLLTPSHLPKSVSVKCFSRRFDFYLLSTWTKRRKMIQLDKNNIFWILHKSWSRLHNGKNTYFSGQNE